MGALFNMGTPILFCFRQFVKLFQLIQEILVFWNAFQDKLNDPMLVDEGSGAFSSMPFHDRYIGIFRFSILTSVIRLPSSD